MKLLRSSMSVSSRVFIGVSIVVLIGISCSSSDEASVAPAKPVADFAFAIKPGGLVEFTNTSVNATGFEWSFGDGASSTVKSPTHVFSSNGSFEVELIANGPGGNSIISKTVTIVLTASFTYQLLANYRVQFTNTSTNPETYSWSFGDGAVSVEKSPVHVYASPGVYLVELTVNANGLVATTSSSVVVQGILVGHWTLDFYRRHNCTPDAGFNIAQTSCVGCSTLQITETQVIRTIPQGTGVPPLVEVYEYSINGNDIVLTLGGVPANPATFLLSTAGLMLTFTMKPNLFVTCKYDEFYKKQ